MIRRYLRTTIDLYKGSLEKFFILVFIAINKLPKGKFATSLGLERIWSYTHNITVCGQEIKFHNPNWLTQLRAKTLFTKEPETINWLNHMPHGSVLWDIGANIGTYSIYAAKNNIRVIAVEPSFMNIEILNRNVISNRVQDLVTIVPCAVGSNTGVLDFYMSSSALTWGGAHNSVGSNIGYDGKPIKDAVSTTAICFTIDNLAEILKLPYPTHIKIDVDGLEAEVLQGASNAIENVKSILIEVDKNYESQKLEIEAILKNTNFKLSFEAVDHQETANQIWTKSLLLEDNS